MIQKPFHKNPFDAFLVSKTTRSDDFKWKEWKAKDADPSVD